MVRREPSREFDVGKFYALIIAVADYDDDGLDLKFPIKEAEALKKVLTERYEFEEEDIYFLENPSRAEIFDYFDRVRKRVTRKDNLLIFYSGHGEWDEAIEMGYWLPKDSNRHNRANWLTNSDIGDLIRGIEANNILLISDACFSGQIFVAKDVNTRSPVETDVSVQKNYETVSRRALTSGAKETVRDGNVFVGHLVKRLEEEQGDYLYAERLYVDIKDIVTNSSRSRQTPEYGVIQRAGDEGSDFVFFRKSE